MSNSPLMSHATINALLQRYGVAAADLARKLNINKATISHWNAKRVPAERVLEIERAAGIPRYEIRPDLYPAHSSPPSRPRSKGRAA